MSAYCHIKSDNQKLMPASEPISQNTVKQEVKDDAQLENGSSPPSYD